MAVTLSSDLITDVMRNADPARLEKAKERLVSVAADSDMEFALALGKVPPATAQAVAGGTFGAQLTGSSPGFGVPISPGYNRPTEPYVEFERMVLRNLLETLLPGAESGAFGSGSSAGVWRSLAADQLAGLYADGGGSRHRRVIGRHEGRRPGVRHGAMALFQQ